MAKIGLSLDKRRVLKDGTYPIRFRVYQEKRRKYYKTGFYADTTLFEEMMKADGNLKKEDKIVRDHLLNELEKARAIIKSMSYFSFNDFESMFFNSHNRDYTDVFFLFDEYIRELNEEDRIKTAISYENARNSFQGFLKDGVGKKEIKLKFGDIDKRWLEDYEKWMTNKGNSYSTIGIYCRNLRRLFNVSINTQGGIPDSCYPFSRSSSKSNSDYVIPSTRNFKRALSFDQIQKIIHFECSGESMTKFRDLFVFSYLCQGMNLIDILNLKWQDFREDRLYFIRSKTRLKRKSDQSNTIVYLHENAINIINKWGNEDQSPDQHIFPFFNQKMTSYEREKCRNQQSKNINNCLKRISIQLKLDVIPTFYYARHSFSTIMRNSGAPIEYISEALGHESTETTKKYLASFEENKVRDYQNKLVDGNFKKNKMKVIK